MKSIKEKAEEYISGFHPSIQRMCKESYIDGANYVISCIEKEILSCKEFSQSQLRLIIQFCEQLEVTNK